MCISRTRLVERRVRGHSFRQRHNSVPATGLELGSDTFSFSGSTLSVSWGASNPGDHIRVLTAAVPEPSSYAMMLAGLSAFGALTYRRRSRMR